MSNFGYKIYLNFFSILGVCIWLQIEILLMISFLTYKMNGITNSSIHTHTVIILTVYKYRMRLCTSISDFEVERAKNAFLTSMFMHLDGKPVSILPFYMVMYLCMHTV